MIASRSGNRVSGFVWATILIVAGGLILSGVAQAGTTTDRNDGAVKRVAPDEFFYADINGDRTWTGADDAKFRIQGGTLSGPMIVGDFDGDGFAQIGLIDAVKVYIDNGNMEWLPNTDPELINFFAPNTGNHYAMVGDFNMDNADDFAKYDTVEAMFFVDANGNKLWDGAPADGQFRIEGGTVEGIPFAGDFGEGAVVGLFATNKFYIDWNGDNSWTPGAETEKIGFFAPTTTLSDVLIGDWDGDGDDNIGKVGDGWIWLDMNGDFVFNGADDAKFKIEGGTLTGDYTSGNFDREGGDDADQVAQFSVTKIFIDDGSGTWAPVGSDDGSWFFAPNTGDPYQAGAGIFDLGDGD